LKLSLERSQGFDQSLEIQIHRINRLVEITSYQPWAINRNDIIVIAGEVDRESGKFLGYAYKNQTNAVLGYYKTSLIKGFAFIAVGLLFIWAVFPIVHIIEGIRLLILNRKCKKALDLVE
jgi:hypothetical protein